MAAEHHLHVFVRQDDVLINVFPLFGALALCVQIFMEIEDRDAVGEFLQRFVHPLDLLVAYAPAHVQDDEVDAVGADQVVVPLVVLV